MGVGEDLLDGVHSRVGDDQEVLSRGNGSWLADFETEILVFWAAPSVT